MQCLSRSLLNRSKLQFWTKLVVTCRTRQGVTYYNVFFIKYCWARPNVVTKESRVPPSHWGSRLAASCWGPVSTSGPGSRRAGSRPWWSLWRPVAPRRRPCVPRFWGPGVWISPAWCNTVRCYLGRKNHDLCYLQYMFMSIYL